ncbi:hypothetical protein ACTA71_009820 [Dictyostelium dimigraforme]
MVNTLSSFKLKYPLILSHGLFGFSRLGPLVYFNNIIQPLKLYGIKCEATTVHPTDSIKNRSLDLYKQMNEIMKKYNTDHCHFLAHSMGGLDSRYLISHLDQNQSVLSLTTLSTPHRGSYIAKWSIENITERFYFEKFIKAIGVPFEAIANLTPDYLQTDFNPNVLDQPHVTYYSYGAYKDSISNVFTPLYFFHDILTKKEGKNDGLVSLTSAKWGEQFKVISNCDHRDLINLGWSGYNAFPIYENIIRDLYKLEQEYITNPKLPSSFILNNNNKNINKINKDNEGNSENGNSNLYPNLNDLIKRNTD